jgi:hypothetical protein
MFIGLKAAICYRNVKDYRNKGFPNLSNHNSFIKINESCYWSSFHYQTLPN